MSIKRITSQRRRELDELVNQLRTQGKRGRLGTASEEHARWAADAQRLGWNAAKLAEEWAISERAASPPARPCGC